MSSVNFCLKSLIRMWASCLFFIKKLFFDLTNAILTAGALYWPIFGGLNCQFRGICSNRELDCFNDFPICQWKSPRSKVTLVLTVRSPIFGGFGSCLAKVIHCRARTVLATFRLKISKLHSVHFRGLTKTFESFYFEFLISAARQEPIFRAVYHWDGKWKIIIILAYWSV